MSEPVDTGGGRRITQKQKIATNYLLLKTRSRWRWVGYVAGLVVASAAGWMLWRVLGR